MTRTSSGYPSVLPSGWIETASREVSRVVDPPVQFLDAPSRRPRICITRLPGLLRSRSSSNDFQRRPGRTSRAPIAAAASWRPCCAPRVERLTGVVVPREGCLFFHVHIGSGARVSRPAPSRASEDSSSEERRRVSGAIAVVDPRRRPLEFAFTGARVDHWQPGWRRRAAFRGFTATAAAGSRQTLFPSDSWGCGRLRGSSPRDSKGSREASGDQSWSPTPGDRPAAHRQQTASIDQSAARRQGEGRIVTNASKDLRDHAMTDGLTPTNR